MSSQIPAVEFPADQDVAPDQPKVELNLFVSTRNVPHQLDRSESTFARIHHDASVRPEEDKEETGWIAA